MSTSVSLKFVEEAQKHLPFTFRMNTIEECRDRFVVKSGFTGCFIIADVRSKIGVVILTNNTYPTRPKDRTAFNEIKKKIIQLLLKENRGI